jgi:hypothetical protein
MFFRETAFATTVPTCAQTARIRTVFAGHFVASMHIIGKSRLFNMTAITTLLRSCPIVDQKAGSK